MRKSFTKVQKILDPDSVFFLGDMFDGGREWSTYAESRDDRESPDKRWRRYDSKYWLKEYRRFSRIFFEPWLRGVGSQGTARHGRKLIAELPGNHDLGLGAGIRISVRHRYQAYFGNGNRYDVVGNHTFVSLDTVSLSAKGQPDTAPGNQLDDQEAHKKDVWTPVEEFLQLAKLEKDRVIGRELRVRGGKPENELLNHTTLELDDPIPHESSLETHRNTDIPSVILTHVPLYRAEGTPCGPLRERYPPSKSMKQGDASLERDEPNSIKVQQGLQYQNVLTPAISNEIVNMVGDVTHVFSGDDHDYCDLIHHGYTSKNSGIREITVKSISWAMGVRYPGIVLASLWNPVNAGGNAIKQATAPTATIQTHLCLLPDQLSIFIWYGWLLLITLASLLVRACRQASMPGSPKHLSNGLLLPLSKDGSGNPQSQESLSTSARPSSKDRLSVRASAGRPRNQSSANGYGFDYGLPLEQSTMYHKSHGREDLGSGEIGEASRRGSFRNFVLAVRADLCSSIAQVAAIVLCWYVYLLWNS